MPTAVISLQFSVTFLDVILMVANLVIKVLWQLKVGHKHRVRSHELLGDAGMGEDTDLDDVEDEDSEQVCVFG